MNTELRAQPEAHALLEQLGERLAAAGVSYCQWKGHWKRARWMQGAGDIDLLVDSACSERLCRTLLSLGFKPALPPPEAQLAGTESWFGYDSARGVLHHLHIHFRLILGNYWTTVYRLPIERAVLRTVIPHRPFAIPAPAVELLLFVVRQMQRMDVRSSEPWSDDVRREFAYLKARSNREELVAQIRDLMPTMDLPFFDRCLHALARTPARPERLQLRRALDRRLRSYARRPSPALLAKRVARRLRLLAPPPGMRFTRGGTVIALLGGDGAGKSTCTHALGSWLRDPFDLVTAHLGRPPRSLTTLAVGGLLKLRRLLPHRAERPTTLDLLRFVCTARDRYLLFQRVRRRAAAGGIALCERYPTPHERLLVGPEIARLLGGERRFGALERYLMRVEQSYYDRIAPPDVSVVMLLDPEVAVRRKTTEPADYVRERNGIVWNTDWSQTGARIVDAGRPLQQVLADLKSIIWAEL